MKYVDEYRSAAVALNVTAGDPPHSDAALGDHGSLRRPDALHRQIWIGLSLAGNHRTGAWSRLSGLRDLLEMIDKAHRHRPRPEVIFCSFGDMLRVPGSQADLFTSSRRRDVRVVYSPLDCLEDRAARNPDKKVVFFAVGFETTAPANAMAVWQARREGMKNFSILVSHVLVPPAIAAILQSPQNRVQGFLGPGHVCAIMGYREYEAISARYRVPIVVSGFEPLDILEGTLMTVRQLEAGNAAVENQYARAVEREGNRVAQDLVSKSSRSATANGAASARSPRAAIACAMSSATMMPSASSKSRRSTPRNRRSVSAGRF